MCHKYLQHNYRNNTLFCKLSNNEVITFNSPMELVGLRVKYKNNNDISIVEFVNLNVNEVWDITLSEI